jgi:alpha-galactosidase
MKTDDIQVWVKQLADGSKAIGIFNLSESLSEFTLRPEIAGIPDKSVLRDLWRQKELAVKDGGWNFRVPAHGVVLVASCKL